METSLHVEKSNVEKRPWGKTTGPKKKEMVPFCQEKKKNSFVKAVDTSSTLASRFRTKKSPSN